MSYLDKMSVPSSAMDRSKRTGPMHTISKLMKQTAVDAYNPQKPFIWEAHSDYERELGSLDLRAVKVLTLSHI